MRTCFLPEFFEKNEDAETSSFLLNVFQDDRHLKIFSEFLLLFGINAPRERKRAGTQNI